MKKGFTLIELLVVIAIIGLLSSVVLTSLNSARVKARDVRRVSDLHQIQTALELFYDTYGRYPVTAGAPTWDGHWRFFSTCLETGAGCGFVITNYQPVMSKVPQDQLDNPSTLDDSDPTYYYRWGVCGDQGYLLKAILEDKNNPVLNNDADGSHYPGWSDGCDDPYYCIKVNWCY